MQHSTQDWTFSLGDDDDSIRARLSALTSDVASTSTVEEPEQQIDSQQFRDAVFQRLQESSPVPSESSYFLYRRNCSPDLTEELTRDGTTEGGKKKKRNFFSKVFGWVGKRVGKLFKGR